MFLGSQTSVFLPQGFLFYRLSLTGERSSEEAFPDFLSTFPRALVERRQQIAVVSLPFLNIQSSLADLSILGTYLSKWGTPFPRSWHVHDRSSALSS